jgi:4-amino-4-deoxy-L-arabinose transferase-like glycosyltransferase
LQPARKLFMPIGASPASQRTLSVWWWIAVAVALRLAWVLLANPNPRLAGGDGPFYLHLGNQIARGNGMQFNDVPMAVVGPVYPTYIAALQWLVGEALVQETARVGQALLSAVLALVLYAIGCRLHSSAAGLWAAGLFALDLRFIVETGAISTETVFSLMLMLTVLAYLHAHGRAKPAWWLLAGMLAGLTTLTRAVAQLLPFVLLAHTWLQRRPRAAGRHQLLLLAGFAIAVAPWVARNWLVFGSPSIGEGGAAHFWLGATGTGMWTGNEQMMTDVERLRIAPGSAQFAYLSDAFKTIFSNPARYVGLRMQRTLGAYAQPFGTVAVGGVFGDISLKAAAGTWGTAVAMLGYPVFWLKLWMYVWHFGSVLLAVACVVRYRRTPAVWLLPLLVIGYVSGLYALLTIIPRYLFPIMPLYMVLAAVFLAAPPAAVATGMDN